MLYERWCAIAASRRDEVALRDLPSGRAWTFGELRKEAEQVVLPASGLICPQGNSPEFVLTLLAAWRAGRATCPLEAGQAALDVPVPPASIAHLKTTSATTGAARCVAFTGHQLAADAENIVATMGLRPDWPNLGVISLAHSYGFSNLVLPLLLHGIPLILAGPPLPEIVRRAAEPEHAITLPAVPALWRAWHEAGAIPTHLRLAISASAPLPLPLEEAVLRECGVKIHNFYGSSECGGIAYDARDVARTDAAIAGSAMKNVDLSIASNGCLTVRSAAVAQGYWPNHEAGLGEGEFRTSDLAEFRDGNVLLRGRLSDQINIAGRKVDPAAIEAALLQHPAIVECLAFGVADAADARGETVVVCYRANIEIAPEALRSFLLERLPAWQVPREWCAVDTLSTSQRGKLSRAEWRKWFLERRGT
jgi:acyl-CoA synthetase (AMP-forming)/AMP-acid ligase II